MWFFQKLLNLFNWKNFKQLDFLDKYDIYDFSYKGFSIEKRNGSYREIYAPNKSLKKIQKEILRNFEENIILPWYITAFRKYFSIKANAKHHINKKIVVSLDIKDFFLSITKDKLENMLLTLWYNKEKVNKLLKIITYKNSLPQWAPTSGFFANWVFVGIDRMIIKILKKYDENIAYTRYADDITFSSNNTKIVNSLRIIENILKQYGYEINKEKTKIFRKNKRQIVTGLVVNEKVSYPRNKYMQLKAMVYNFLKENRWDFYKIKGYLSFLYSVDKKKYDKLKDYYAIKFQNNKNYNKLFNLS